MSREFTLLMLAGLLAASIAMIGYAVTAGEPRDQLGETITMPLDAPH